MCKIFIFLYNDMNPGGIQTNMYNISKNMIENDIRVIWICTNKIVSIYDGYRDIINDEKIIITNLKTFLSKRDIFLKSGEDIRIMSFSPISYLDLNKIKVKCSNYNISTYYIMPHFENKDYFPDDFFKIKIVKNKMKKLVTNLFIDLDKKNIILFFDKVHVKKLEEYYNFRIENIHNKLAKLSTTPPSIDISKLKVKAKRTKFRIITISRFEFPHKGYIIGLIKAFSKLKGKYDNLYLDIIGYGDDAKMVEDTICSLDEYVRSSIILHGYKPYDELKDLFETANLNIGVGGALLDGARYGVPSLPARHYSYSGEVYGFLPDSIDKLLSDEPGFSVDTFIDKAITISELDYIKLSLNTMQTDKKRGKVSNPLWIFDVIENKGIFLSKRQRVVLITLKIRMKLYVSITRLVLLFKNPKMFYHKLKTKYNIM